MKSSWILYIFNSVIDIVELFWSFSVCCRNNFYTTPFDYIGVSVVRATWNGGHYNTYLWNAILVYDVLMLIIYDLLLLFYALAWLNSDTIKSFPLVEEQVFGHGWRVNPLHTYDCFDNAHSYLFLMIYLEFLPNLIGNVSSILHSMWSMHQVSDIHCIVIHVQRFESLRSKALYK